MRLNTSVPSSHVATSSSFHRNGNGSDSVGSIAKYGHHGDRCPMARSYMTVKMSACELQNTYPSD